MKKIILMTFGLLCLTIASVFAAETQRLPASYIDDQQSQAVQRELRITNGQDPKRESLPQSSRYYRLTSNRYLDRQ